MSLPFEIENKREAIRQEVTALGAELLEIQFRRIGPRSVIALIVDKDGGVTLDDCVKINRRISQMLDELTAEIAAGMPGHNFLNGSYFIEVNSPGLDRPLKSEKDFMRAKGDTVRLVYRDEGGVVRDYVGEIREVANGSVRFGNPQGRPLEVKLEAIVKGTREIRFKK